MRLKNTLNLKAAIFAAWRINLYRPDPLEPIPGWIWRRMGAA